MSADSISASPTLDSFELAQSGEQVIGTVEISKLPRLAELVDAPQGDLRYQIDGLIDAEGHPSADVHLDARCQLTCQRCNAPLDFVLDHTARFRFVASEEELNALPIEDDDVDVIVGSRYLRVHDWIEDEAILSLPLVPRHDGPCPVPLKLQSDSTTVGVPNPFAALLALRDDDNPKSKSH